MKRRIEEVTIGAVLGAVLVVVGSAGCGELTDDGWQAADFPGHNVVLKGMEFHDEDTGWLAAEGATGVDDKGAWRTDDGGDSWEQVHDTYQAYVVQYDDTGQRAWMGGSDSQQLWFSDDGQQFQPQSDGFDQQDMIGDLHFWDPETGFVTGQTSDRIHWTDDGGENFEMIEMQREMVAGTNGVEAHGDDAWIASGADFTQDGSGARLLHSEDFGQTWDVIQLEDTAHDFEGGSLHDVYAVDDTEVWTVGINRQMYFSRDGMESWNQVEGIPDTVRNFYAIDGHGDHLIAAGSADGADEDSFVFSSEDGGDTWELMDFGEDACLESGCTIEGLEYAHEDLAYAYGPNGTLLELTSGF